MSNLLSTEHIVNLHTLNEGAAAEIFERELAKILANIQDANTDPEEKREITLTFTIKPDEHRKMARTTISARSKLAPPLGTSTTIFFGTHEGKTIAVETNPNQGQLFERPAGQLRAIPLMGKKAIPENINDPTKEEKS